MQILDGDIGTTAGYASGMAMPAPTRAPSLVVDPYDYDQPYNTSHRRSRRHSTSTPVMIQIRVLKDLTLKYESLGSKVIRPSVPQWIP